MFLLALRMSTLPLDPVLYPTLLRKSPTPFAKDELMTVIKYASETPAQCVLKRLKPLLSRDTKGLETAYRTQHRGCCHSEVVYL